MPCKTFPETLLRIRNFWFQLQYGVQTSHSYYFEDTPWRHTQLLLNSVKWPRAIYKELNTLNTTIPIHIYKISMQLSWTALEHGCSMTATTTSTGQNSFFLLLQNDFKKWVIETNPSSLLAKELTRPQVQISAWAQQLESASPFSCVFFSQDIGATRQCVIPLRQRIRPGLRWQFLTNSGRSSDGRCQQTDPIVSKKSRCVNLGERTKLCTQAIDDSINRQLRKFPSNFTLYLGKSPTESRGNWVVSWNTCNK